MKQRMASIWHILKEIIRHPASLHKVLLPEPEEGRFSHDYVMRTHGIAHLPCVSLLDLCPDFNETLQHYSYLPGTSMTVDIALLMALAGKTAECDYLEVGSWRGESLANVSANTRSSTSITLGPEQMKALGFSEKQIALHGMYSDGIPHVTEVHADSTQLDFTTLEKRFDLIFIDGDHRKAAIESDTRNAFKVRKDERSVIVWHDYGWDTERVRYNTLAGILDGAPEHARQHIYHVAQTKCAIYWPFDIPSFPLERHGSPKVNFRIQIKADHR